MASILPYAAPYTRTATRTRPTLQLDGRVARALAVVLGALLIYTLVQLTLASIASGAINDMYSLGQTIAAYQREHDALQAEALIYKSPAWVEQQARERKLVPITSIEYVR